MVIINACLSYFDYTLPSKLLFIRYEIYLVKKEFVIICYYRCLSLSVGLLCPVCKYMYELLNYIQTV